MTGREVHAEQDLLRGGAPGQQAEPVEEPQHQVILEGGLLEPEKELAQEVSLATSGRDRQRSLA